MFSSMGNNGQIPIITSIFLPILLISIIATIGLIRVNENSFYTFFLFFTFIAQVSFAGEFNFDTKSIQVIENGNLIIANDGKAISQNKDLEIKAKKFEYFKNKKILIAYQGEAFLKSKNLEIKFNIMEFDEKNYIYTAKNEISVFDLNKKISIKKTNY